MADFFSFYQNGGVFMHVITLGAVVGVTSVLVHGRKRRMGAEDTKLLRLADRVAGVCVALGVLGTVFGLIDMGAALASLDPDAIDPVRFGQAAARGLAIAPTPIGYALMCAIPIWIATTVNRTRRPAVIPREGAASE
jgi:hypothetical protein